MHNPIKHISCLIFFLFSLMMHGQALPSLGTAKEISKGSLPNGMEYYLVTNPSDKGFADYALARKHPLPAAEERRSLDDLAHFGSRKAYRFLSENGVGYDSFGLISHTEAATVFSFRNVPVHNQSVADSTLLMVMDIAAKSQTPQAIVISGDINASKIKERMELLSMTVSRLGVSTPSYEYKWEPEDSLRVVMSQNLSSDVAMIRLIFSTERLPKDKLNTPQPLLTGFYAQVLADIFKRRVSEAFAQASLPLAWVDTKYEDCSQGPGDERYYFSVYTSYGCIEEATAQVAAVLSSLDNFGALEREFVDAKRKLVKEASSNSGIRYLSNREYVDKCISSYLYGTDLAAPSTTHGFVAANNLPVKQELPIFNAFSSAILDSAANAVLRFDVPVPEIDKDSLTTVFNRSWEKASKEEYIPKNSPSTFPLAQTPARLRIKKENTDPISGGKLLSFNNGLRVIYKKLPVKDEMYYALMLKGGVTGVPGLKKGESAFVGDMLSLYDVAGVKAGEFRSRLASRGITMNCSAGVSDMRISGVAPSADFTLLINALQALANNRSLNKEAFEEYKKSEKLRLDLKSMVARDFNPVLDSIMRPGYTYSQLKNIANLQDDLPERAESYFESAFSKVNDGLLVLVGDFDEEELKKELCRLMGGFRVQSRFVPRSKMSSRLSLGSSSFSEQSRRGVIGASEMGVNLALSAAAPFNLRNYMSFKVAARGVELALIRELADLGATVSVTCRNEVFPVERISMFINCRLCNESGMPSDVSVASPSQVLDAVRGLLSDLDSISLSDRDMKAFKTRLISEYESSLANPEGVIDAVLIRYSDGRDVVTGYKDAINSVSKDSVKETLSLLSEGADVEYIIY